MNLEVVLLFLCGWCLEKNVSSGGFFLDGGCRALDVVGSPKRTHLVPLVAESDANSNFRERFAKGGHFH